MSSRPESSDFAPSPLPTLHGFGNSISAFQNNEHFTSEFRNVEMDDGSEVD